VAPVEADELGGPQPRARREVEQQAMAGMHDVEEGGQLLMRERAAVLLLVVDARAVREARVGGRVMPDAPRASRSPDTLRAA
jgi:sensor domain CHASE-containing protein